LHGTVYIFVWDHPILSLDICIIWRKFDLAYTLVKVLEQNVTSSPLKNERRVRKIED